MKNKFSCEKDRTEFKKVLSYNLQLVCGKLCNSNSLTIMQTQKEILDSIKSIEVVPSGPNDILDKSRMTGCTNSNVLNGTSEILMKGFLKAKEHENKSVQKTFSHELFHSIYCLMNRSKDGKDSKGNRLLWYGTSKGEPFIGGGGTLVSRKNAKRYGKLFEETMMDMKAVMAFSEFDTEYQKRNRGVTADTILFDNISKWGDGLISSYSKLVPLTQLMIAAFANEPNINYHKWIQSGNSMEKLMSIRNNGKKIYANDFLYGMMYDPIHIMEEYDKYMGDGAYIELLKTTDLIYEKCVNTDQIDKQLLKKAMLKIADFSNKRSVSYKKNGTFSDDEVLKLSSQFNKIWNSMMKEYGLSYSQRELWG